ncbi:MAG: hypothetical protein LAT76_07415 [Schleiferiaceae bacterium]|nr:hypothetical protein [Schleiferiaceae bacterium]
MKNNFVTIIAVILLGSFIGLQSCDNEIQINAPYQVVPVLYGILDHSKDTNWVRIGRSYQGGDMGRLGGVNEPDSIYYDELDVTIEELVNNTVTITYTLVYDNTTKVLNDGFFTTEGFHLYRLEATLNPAARYRVTVLHEGELLMTATTEMVQAPAIRDPLGNRPIGMTSTIGQALTWDNVRNGRIYQSMLRLHYIEVTAPDFDSVDKFLDLNLPTQIANNIAGTGTITTRLTYPSYVSFLSANLDTDVNKYRFAQHFDMFVTVGEDQLATYISVKQPSDGIVQDKPDYTNIEGGIGIFSSRTTAEKLSIAINQNTADSLVFGQEACGLRFSRIRPLPSPRFCFCDPTLFQEESCDPVPF